MSTAPVFYCNGDPDDHLRLTVLLALELATRRCRDAVDAATATHSSWTERRDALAEILRAASLSTSARSAIAVLVDPDALPARRVDGSSTWDDATFARERGEFLDILLNAVDRGGWLLVRPAASAELSARLDHLAPSDNEPFSEAVGDVETLPPVAARLVARMRERGELRELAIARWRLHDEPTDDVVETALAHLSANMRSTLDRLCLARRPLAMNGHCGPFVWGSIDEGFDTVDPVAVDELIDRGLLVGLATDSFWIPRTIRVAVTQQQQRRPATVETHLALARATGNAPHQLIERHWHATLAGDLTLALTTARYYVNDLRELARSLSAQRRFAEAAEVYRRIVTTDGADAYAWEYLGYNLARAHEKIEQPVANEIDAAYARAHELAPGNPLFHGRLVGFQLARNGTPAAGIEQMCAFYRRSSGQEAVEWFGWQVAQGLRRAGRRIEADTLCERWRITMPPRRLPRRFGSGASGIILAPDFDAPLPEFELSDGA